MTLQLTRFSTDGISPGAEACGADTFLVMVH